MEDSEIELLSGHDKLQEASAILLKFLQNNQNAFTFPNLSSSNRRVILWTALFQRLQKNESKPVHAMCLATIRILSRDKTDLESLICEKWINVLIERAGLYSFVSLEEESMVSLELPEKDIAVEALKCLCNITYHSEVARELCAHTDIAQGLVARLRVYKDIPFKDDIILYDMKLLFILTALRQDMKTMIKDELHGMDYLTSCLNEIVQEASSDTENASSSGGDGDHHCFLPDEKQAIAVEILKAQFNLIIHSGPEDVVSETEESMYLKLMPVLTALLYAHCTTQEKLHELHNNIANLLTRCLLCFYSSLQWQWSQADFSENDLLVTHGHYNLFETSSVPVMFCPFLTPLLNKGESSTYIYDDRNMDALQALVQLLHQRLAGTTSINSQYENLSPILIVLIKCARSHRAQRKFLRQVVLPPLRDVSRPPEQGSALRNQLCQLLTTPVTAVRDLVAEFLFILCKEKVSRMVKYTGFGNAAGHLAQKGLLGGGRGARYSSSSDDSDTEEYREAAPHYDPVVGCTRPPRPDPFHGMTEEQKEYEAMKLVNMFDRLASAGVVRPARVGPDGRPQPVDHVLQLREQPPNRPQS